MAKRSQVLPGAVFGRWTVIRRLPRDGKRYFVLCRCSCGVKKQVNINNIVQGVSRSCGCLERELNIRRSTKHGMANNRAYFSWYGMVARCTKPSKPGYESYGAKGVKVCNWLEESPNHLVELLGDRPVGRSSIDRFPVHNGNYACGSCLDCIRNGWKRNVRWATPKEQVNNRGQWNRRLTAFGKTLTLAEWRDLSGIGWMTLYGRVMQGLTPEEIVTKPDSKGNCYRPGG